MIYYLLLLVSIILTVLKTSLYNSYAQRHKPMLSETFRFNAVSYGAAALVALVGMLVGKGSVSPETVLCAFLYAIIVISLQTVSITAMRVGAMSATAICVMYGMIIPAVAGPIFWHERIGGMQIVGILLMLVSLWLIREKTTGEEKTRSGKWLVLAVPAFFLSGFAGLMEKIHQSTEARDERLSFVLVACGFMLAFSIVAALVLRGKGDKRTTVSANAIALVAGLVIGLYSTVNLTLSGKLDSMIYYPIANGGAMLVTVLVSVIVFKERFDKPKTVGTALGLVGILLLSLPL